MNQVVVILHLLRELQLVVVHQPVVDHHHHRAVRLQCFSDGSSSGVANDERSGPDIITEAGLEVVPLQVDPGNRALLRRARTSSADLEQDARVASVFEDLERKMAVATGGRELSG